MIETTLQTKNLKLIQKTLEEVRAWVDALNPSDKEHLSAEWMAQLQASTSTDVWKHGFTLVQRHGEAVVGEAGFKAPPGTDGMVEIAYGVNPEHQGKGYATEAAQALVQFAFGSGRVRVVRAHTLPESNASKRVLIKCGFRHVGEVIDPDDGLVWRWEKQGGGT